MKKYIPYIVIPLLTYLAVGFVKMQFNPVYWKAGERSSMLTVAFAAMTVYPIAKYMINDLKE